MLDLFAWPFKASLYLSHLALCFWEADRLREQKQALLPPGCGLGSANGRLRQVTGRSEESMVRVPGFQLILFLSPQAGCVFPVKAAGLAKALFLSNSSLPGPNSHFPSFPFRWGVMAPQYCSPRTRTSSCCFF